jgi:hypothetical protein
MVRRRLVDQFTRTLKNKILGKIKNIEKELEKAPFF